VDTAYPSPRQPRNACADAANMQSRPLAHCSKASGRDVACANHTERQIICRVPVPRCCSVASHPRSIANDSRRHPRLSIVSCANVLRTRGGSAGSVHRRLVRVPPLAPASFSLGAGCLARFSVQSVDNVWRLRHVEPPRHATRQVRGGGFIGWVDFQRRLSASWRCCAI